MYVCAPRQSLTPSPKPIHFYNLLKTNEMAYLMLTCRPLTVFAPINQAFEKYNGSLENLALYHMTKESRMLEDFKETLIPTEDDYKPLWITIIPGKHNTMDYYINNAMILFNQSNVKSTLKYKGNTVIQILHIINEVLEPVQYNSNYSKEISNYNPNAFDVLNQTEGLNLSDYRVCTFRQRVLIEQKKDIFTNKGCHTFFIPVDAGFKTEQRLNKIDQLVIKGHVLPKKVIFIAPTPEKVQYRTLVHSNELQVVVSFSKSQNKVYVQSDTLVGDASHQPGVVLAEIVKGNIPVSNGVVHLIQRPLMVVDSTVKDFLEENKNGPVGKFYEIIHDYGGEIMSSISHLNDVTLFVPSNDALDKTDVKKMLQDKNWLREILKLHYVKKRLTFKEIKDKAIRLDKTLSRKWYDGVPTAAYNKMLYFDVVWRSTEISTVTVEGSGGNATIIIPNIAITNGIVHVIDRVLGVPSTDVLDKLGTYQGLNLTHFLGQQCGINNQLNNTKKWFTYFVPLDEAWTNPENNDLSTIKKVFMPKYSYYAKKILARHLIIANQTYRMTKLMEMNLNFKVKVENEGFSLDWGTTTMKVLYPDIECTNGVIHVIDGVFPKKSGFQMTSGASLFTFAPQLIMILIINKWHL
ncbi:fasciclin-1 isoform X2 [Monomorium pharaonis]|uniref:fasciclin-1 isoform X2 n=1 Tax=Monomorium pharaonis TaxID=307658 RepID=UPI0017462E12|nr:fasciclin-1 isoform X2 [Monomorium pharaonis]